MLPFGPQLIGQTEKSLNAVLARLLTDEALSEPQWVALRLTAQFDGAGDLADVVRSSAHLTNPGEVLAELGRRGLVDDGELTTAGEAVLARVGDRIAALTAPVWAAVHASDAAAAARALNTVLEHTRSLVASSEPR